MGEWDVRNKTSKKQKVPDRISILRSGKRRQKAQVDKIYAYQIKKSSSKKISDMAVCPACFYCVFTLFSV